jgi:PAS domain S-box-containing protein
MGACIAAGWILDVPSLCALAPTWVPAPLPVGVVLLALGAAIMADGAGWIRIARVAALTALAVFIVMSCAVWGLGFPSDTLSSLHVPADTPLSVLLIVDPVTLIPLMMVVVVILAVQRFPGPVWISGLLWACSITPLALGLMAGLGYVSNRTGAETWSAYTGIALPTAAGMFLTGLSAVCLLHRAWADMPDSTTETIGRGKSILARLLSTFAVVLVLGMAVMTALISRQYSETLLEGERNQLGRVVDLVKADLQIAVGGLYEDAYFLAHTSAVRKLAEIDPGQFGEAAWRDQADEVGEILQPLVESKASYLQARVLGDPARPTEWVRVDRTTVSGPVSRTPQDALQDKSRRTYAQKGFAASPGSVLLSDIELNREHGQISEPHMPVLRAMCPVETPSGETGALVVINMDLRPLFQRLTHWGGEVTDVRLLNAAGDFLLHPDETRAFAHETGGQYRLSDWLGDHEGRKRPEEWRGRYEVVPTDDLGLAVVGLEAVFIKPGDAVPLCYVSASQPLEQFAGKYRHLQSFGAILSLLLVLMGIGMVYVLARRQLMPLRGIVASTRAIGRGSDAVALPVDAPDEAGILARAISQMYGQIRERTDALEREVSERQRAVSALRVSEGRLQAALVGGEQVAWEWYPDTRSIGWLGDTDSLFGKAPGDMPVSLAEFLDCFVHGDQPALKKALEQVSGEQLGPIEARVVIQGQETRHVLLQARRMNGSAQIEHWAGTVRDVTRERKTQRAMLKERERARHYLELAPVMFVAMDGEGVVNLINSHACYVLQASRDQLIGSQLLTSYVHPDDLTSFEGARTGLLEGRYPYCHLECRMVDVEGGEHVIAWHNILVRDGDGQPAGTLSCGEDVTERKRIEHQVARQRATTALRVDILEALSRPDPRKEILHACAEQIRAQTRVDAVMLWHDGDRKALYLEACAGVCPAKDSPLQRIPLVRDAEEDVLRTRTMAHVSLEDTLVPLPDTAWLREQGLQSCLVCPLIVGEHRFGTMAIFSSTSLKEDQVETLKEITPTVAVGLDRRLEEDLAARLKAAVDSAGESIIITSPEGVIEYVNPTFTKTSGYSFEEAVGNKPSMLQHPDQDPTFFADLWETVTRGDTWTGQLKNKRKDGAAFFEEVTISPVMDSEGNLRSIVGVQRDVTLQRKLAGQMQQAQKLEALGTLAGGIAHDFNNILAAIGGYAELLRGDQEPDSQDSEDLDQILSGVNRAKDLVRQILTFTRQTETKRQPLALGVVVKEVCKLLQSTLPANIKVSQNIDEGCGMVLADPTNMHQIVLNLATNAHHAMREKGGTLRIDLQPFTLSEEDARASLDLRAGPYVCLSVEDEGYGMDAETQQRIFEPFFTTKKAGEGTGMGLATVHGIVKAHGGEIKCYSESGQGTIFRVYLPSIAHEEDGPTLRQSTVPGGTETILVVDDEEVIVGLLDRTLSRLGYRVIGTESSLEALRIFHDAPQLPDLVITDQTMPNLVGKELVKLMWKKRPDLPVIISTGFSETFSEEHAKDMGFAAFLSKPVDLPSLARVVRRVLDEVKGDDEGA